MKKHIFMLIILAGFLYPVVSTFAQNYDKLFQEAIYKEEGEGNLKEAIDIYYQIANKDSADRGLRAKSLMQIGLCYEKLGKKNAVEAFEKIVSEFSDQTEFVKLAQKRLNSYKSSKVSLDNQVLTMEQIKKEMPFLNGLGFKGVSPDGSSFLYIDQTNNDDEIIKFDIITGETFQLTNNNTSAYGAPNASFPWRCIWSPDSEHIIYLRNVWRINNKDVKIHELRMMDKNGRNDKVLMTDSIIPVLITFMPDGKSVLAISSDTKNENKPKLVSISLDNLEVKSLKNLNENYGNKYSISPNGKHLLFLKKEENSSNWDVFVMNMSTLKETQITNNENNDWDPEWSPDGSQIIFLSNRLNSNDLYKIAFENENNIGEPINIKSGLGDNVKIMGVDKNGGVYFSTSNESHDIMTLNIEDLFNNKQAKPESILNPISKIGGYAPKFSKDGRYISYLNNIRFKSLPTEDSYLGEKYLINIYDTQTKKTRLMDIDLYLAMYTRELAWREPNWSYDNKTLLVYGTVKDNYKGGFYAVNVFDETVTPIYTKPGHKKGTNYVRLGNEMMFSRDNQKIYYTSMDFKELFEFNLMTKEEKSLLVNEDGFWFDGFIDKEETKCIALNRFGYFFHDINTNQKIKFGSRDDGIFMGKTDDGKYYFLLDNDKRNITKVSTDGSEPKKSVSIEHLFENMNIGEVDIRYDGKLMVLSAVKSTGQEVNKLNNVFN